METKICQSCSMPLVKEEDYGTTKSDERSDEYCVHCLKDGEFTQDINLEQAIAQCVEYADMTGATKEEALAYATNLFPTLKRWHCTCTDDCASGYNPNCTCTSSECHCAEKQ